MQPLGSDMSATRISGVEEKVPNAGPKGMVARVERDRKLTSLELERQVALA